MNVTCLECSSELVVFANAHFEPLIVLPLVTLCPSCWQRKCSAPPPPFVVAAVCRCGCRATVWVDDVEWKVIPRLRLLLQVLLLLGGGVRPATPVIVVRHEVAGEEAVAAEA